MKRLTVALAALGLVLAVAGCGGGGGGGGGERLTKEEYEQRLQRIDDETTKESQKFGLLLGQLATTPSTVDLDEVAKQTEATQTTARKAAEEYEALNPPEEVEDLNERLAKGTRAFADDLDELREAAGNDDRNEAAEFARKVQAGGLDSLKELAKVGDEFQKKGYKLTS